MPGMLYQQREILSTKVNNCKANTNHTNTKQIKVRELNYKKEKRIIIILIKLKKTKELARELRKTVI